MDPSFSVWPLKAVSTVAKLDGLAFEAFPGCVTRYFTLLHDFCRPGPQKWRSTPRDVAIFFLSLYF